MARLLIGLGLCPVLSLCLLHGGLLSLLGAWLVVSELITNISSFNTECLLPFISGFFTSSVGLCFVGTVVIVVVLRGLASLFKTKFS